MYSIEEAPYCLNCPLAACYEESNNITRDMCPIPKDLIKKSAISALLDDVSMYLNKPRVISEFAKLIGVSRGTVQHWGKVGKIDIQKLRQIGSRGYPVHKLYVMGVNESAW